MYKVKRMIALIMAALLIGSTVCGPAMAAEVTGEEPVSVQEETTDQESSLQEVTEEPQNEPEDLTEEDEEAQGQDAETEIAAEGTEESDNPEISEEALPLTEESREVSGKNATESAEIASTTEPEDEYLPIVVADGVTDEAGNDAYGASAAWDAEKLASLPVLDTDVSRASDGCIMMGLPGEYIADQQAVLDRINEIRKEACMEGVCNPETGRPLTEDDYVPLKWSHELEEIARIRAAETSMTANHKRTNGGSWQSVESEYTYVGECAAWNFSSSAASGIEQWYAEKGDWLEGNDDEAGHYTTLIRPAMRYVGGGTFYSPNTKYPNATLVEFYTKYDGDGLDESFVDMTGECIQKLEVEEGNLKGNPFLTGTLSGVKGDEYSLFLTSDVTYSGVFTANTKGLLFADGVNWSSDNSGVASVSSDGTVTAGKCGSTTITAQAENGSSASAEFVVDHVFQKLPAVAATCTAAGLTEGEKCANCGTVTIKQETVPAKGHAYGNWKVTKNATCTAAGSREKVCANCGGKVTETIGATGHKWNTTYTVDKGATCSEEGSESKHCSVCDAINKSTVRAIPKKEHTYGNWRVKLEAACARDGISERVCTNCGNRETKPIPATGHKWNNYYTVDKEATCTEEGSESIHCSVCAALDKHSARAIPMKDHIYGSWKVIKAATETETGLRERVCTVCGKKVTEKIPVLAGTWIKNSRGWWYQWSDGSYPRDRFLEIKGKTYYFDGAGYMVTGWKKVDGTWYYFDGSGAMVYGWRSIGGRWYCFDEEGKMIENNWAGRYYLGAGGAMVTGWQKIRGAWYYFNGSGVKQTGWQRINNTWYFFDEDGVMATNTWIGSYYLGADGKWIPGYKPAI